MLKPEQLRLGNYIYSEVTTVNVKVTTQVLKLIESEIKTKELSRYKPIPLTEEWLLKFGFERKFFNKEETPRWINKSFYMFIDAVWYITFKRDGYVSFIAFDCFLKDLRYVHQLQNLYFALTGKELEVEL